MADTKVTCPICKKDVALTALGELPKHGGKIKCSGSGYTPKEAESTQMYSGRITR